MPRKWIVAYAPMYMYPDKQSVRLRYLFANTVVEILDMSIGEIWTKISYGDSNGWMESKFLEPYVQNYPADCVEIYDIQTPDKYDAQQYVNWKGVKQVNMCGEMCVAYLLRSPLSTILRDWEGMKPSFFRRIFGQGRAAGTGYGDLIDLLALFSVTGIPFLEKTYTPDALMQLVENKFVIAGCKIDSTTGRLRGQGVGHWVGITDVFQERTGYGHVDIYNPYPNRIERYSWAEFVASAHAPYGCMVNK